MNSRFVLYLLLISICICSCSDSLREENEQPRRLPPTNQNAPALLPQAERFYYFFDEKVYIQERRDLLFVQFDEDLHADALLSDILSSTQLQVWEHKGRLYTPGKGRFNFAVLQSVSGAVTEDIRSSIREKEGVRSVSYMNECKGQPMAAGYQIAVQLKPTSDRAEFEELVAQYNCTIQPGQFLDPGMEMVAIPKDYDKDALELAAIFQESELFTFSCPNFYYFDILCSADTYYPYQWGLKYNGQFPGYTGIDINVEPAWNITQGSNVVVAVIDYGVELNHPDLSGNLLSGYDVIANNPGGGPVEIGDIHGTPVAGIIAAQNNNIGISGVAPSCKILPIRALSSNYGSIDQIIANAITWAQNNGADIINCSFGTSGYDPCVYTSIFNATTQGRNGKGCIVVAASGNDGNSVLFPASFDSVLAVGAVSYNGMRKTFISPDGETGWASNYGNTLNVMAPGVRIASTDRQGYLGFNQSGTSPDFPDNDYTNQFNGSSAAAPFASGVAALVLSQYPDLTEAQVRRAIEFGCTKPSGYSYYYDDQYPPALRNDEVGCGIIDASQTLLFAANMHQQNVLDNMSGFDFVITNHSSYPLEDLYVSLTGKIGGVETTLVASDPGDVGVGEKIGYPVYRGEILNAANPGAPITDISLHLSAVSPDYSGLFHIAATIDQPYPIYYYDHAFGYGNLYQCSVPSSTVPNASRRILYIDIL